MSELTSYNSERIYWSVEQVEREAGDIDDLHLDDNLFYLKSEADEVIDELKMKLAAAQQVLRLNKPKALYSNFETMSKLNRKIYDVERRERHQKYKRCLAMTMWCDSEANYWYDSSKVQQCWRYGYYIRWFNRWSKLSNLFTDKKVKYEA